MMKEIGPREGARPSARPLDPPMEFNDIVHLDTFFKQSYGNLVKTLTIHRALHLYRCI